MPTLIELTKRHNGDARIPITEVLLQENPLFEDAEFKPANKQSQHVYSVRDRNVGISRTGLYEGTNKASSGTDKKSEDIAYISSLSVIDSREIDMADGGNTYSEDEIFNHASVISEQVSYDFFYGSGDNQMRGIISRDEYNAISDGQVFGADGTGSNLSSIYLVNWNSTYFAHAKNGIGGIDSKYMGEDLFPDGLGGYYPAQRYLIQFGAALVIDNYRNVARIANVQLDSTSADYWASIQYRLVEAVNKLQTRNGKIVAYANGDAISVLEKGQLSKGNVYYTAADKIDGYKVGSFSGIPVKRVDLISSTEFLVS